MAAQTTDKPRQRYGKNGKRMAYPMAADTLIREGTIVVLEAGLAKECEEGEDLVAVGVAWRRADNTGGGAGAKKVEVDEGDFPVDNSTAGDALTNATVGTVVFGANNNTYAATDGTGARSAQARHVGFFSDGRPIVRLAQVAK